MLTQGLFEPEVELEWRATQPGMAFFAHTGPVGETCQNCAHFDLPDKPGRRWKAHCRKYTKMTSRCGAMVPKVTPACQYFARRP